MTRDELRAFVERKFWQPKYLPFRNPAPQDTPLGR